ncbi:MAG: hypothetical protein ACHQJX_06850, partial [Candidatus Acidiferrales bacterium]
DNYGFPHAAPRKQPGDNLMSLSLLLDATGREKATAAGRFEFFCEARARYENREAEKSASAQKRNSLPIKKM